jgi:FixJ family two-component response regulator
MERGCKGFIQKPFGAGELSQKIREVLDNGVKDQPEPDKTIQ